MLNLSINRANGLSCMKFRTVLGRTDKPSNAAQNKFRRSLLSLHHTVLSNNRVDKLVRRMLNFSEDIINQSIWSASEAECHTLLS